MKSASAATPRPAAARIARTDLRDGIFISPYRANRSILLHMNVTRGRTTRAMRDAPEYGQDEASGFTLVELMVVLVIIGLASAAVILTLPERGGSLFAEAERFA